MQITRCYRCQYQAVSKKDVRNWLSGFHKSTEQWFFGEMGSWEKCLPWWMINDGRVLTAAWLSVCVYDCIQIIASNSFLRLVQGKRSGDWKLCYITDLIFFCLLFKTFAFITYIHTNITLTLYPWRSSRDISGIPPKHPPFNQKLLSY
jgi:hypothetical protein